MKLIKSLSLDILLTLDEFSFKKFAKSPIKRIGRERLLEIVV